MNAFDGPLGCGVVEAQRLENIELIKSMIGAYFTAYMIDRIQYNGKFLTLPFFRLGHFEDIQFVARQFLPQLVQNLSIVHILFNVGHDDSLFHQLVIDPVG